MSQISRVYKLELPILIRVLYKSFNCQRCEHTYYEILRISPSATQKEIKAAYIKLSKETHPDSGSKGNHADFVKINEAYTILSKKESRHFYDAQLKPRTTRTTRTTSTTYTTHRNNSYQDTEYDYYGRWPMHLHRSQTKRKINLDDREREINFFTIILLAGLFMYLIVLRSWSDHIRDAALKRSARSKKTFEGKTLEERLQIVDE